MSVLKWALIIRPGTLIAAFVPVAFALSAASKSESFSSVTAIVTLIAALALQILSNLVNDYYDYERGADTIDRLGPKRALSEGVVSAAVMKRAIYLVASLAIVCGIWLVVLGGIPILLIGLSALLFAWLYTATRYSLSYLGIADIFVFIYFGPVATVGTYYLQCNTLPPLPIWLLSVGCGAVSMAVLTVNNVRDVVQDAINGKRTAIVRIGVRFGQMVYTLLLFVPIGVLIVLDRLTLGMVLLPLLAILSYSMFTSHGRAYNRLLVFTGLYNLAYLLVALL